MWAERIALKPASLSRRTRRNSASSKEHAPRIPLSWWTQAPRNSVFLPFTKNPLVLQLRVRNPNQASASSTISPFFSSSALHWYSSGCSASQSRGWETGMSADAVPSLTSVSACATTFSPSRTETLTVSPPVTENFHMGRNRFRRWRRAVHPADMTLIPRKRFTLR